MVIYYLQLNSRIAFVAKLVFLGTLWTLKARSLGTLLSFFISRPLQGREGFYTWFASSVTDDVQSDASPQHPSGQCQYSFQALEQASRTLR